MTTDKTDFALSFMSALPQAQALGLEILELADGVAVIRMPYSEDLVGNPDTGVIHGGAVSTLMDTCGGAATIVHPDNAGGTATIGLRIDYLRAATPGQAVTARAECHHITRAIAFVRATAHDDDPDRPVATATGTFTVETLA
ncbi:thioesterase [Salipiger aestuarii]|uniref:Uncharacterized protein (TIGR00369 family) n=1 Tax=Salipiger aestuarii TaxID=568098 RepID=A0A327XRC9_9RHOB|nr:PaaI family thioesterase [Salipiger aestuarii]EIE52439.1 thioesterase family protein [Citreicella sp. 357]KAA8605818.1 thioesterase [Salipiger aestuarii]KAA8608495.1 thioesterase [Salipiger aestuarii]KAB2540587.1 thioesterase [Salipiger aestuarii]RAK11283.1 uncharacterized protein (TIGR00369 family) [Salipiger aestuarii]